MWSSIKGWFWEKIWDRIFSSILGRIQINYQKLIQILLVIFFCAALILSFINLHEDGWDIAIIHSMPAAGSDAGETETIDLIVHRWNWQLIAVIMAWIIAILLLLAYVMLRIEKKNNRIYHFTQRRRLDSENAKFPNSIYSYVQRHMSEKLKPDEWPLAGLQGQAYKNTVKAQATEMLNKHIEVYTELCKKIAAHIAEHVHEKNESDIIHVSIKAFLCGEDNRMKVVNMGQANSHPNSMIEDVNIISPNKNWDNWRNEAYDISEDYVMQRIIQDKTNPQIFTCADLEAFKRANEKSGNDRAGEYRIPPNNKREFKATIVCPVASIKENPADGYSIIGAICVDTTNKYDDWSEHDSYEELVVSFSSACIVSLFVHNIKEISRAFALLNA